MHRLYKMNKSLKQEVFLSLTQEYPTEPLDEIPALQAEFELAGKKKNIG